MPKKIILSLLLVSLSPALYAHPGIVLDNPLFSGVLHPLTGIDHLLVLAALGYLSSKPHGLYGRSLPGLFLALMGFGAFSYFGGFRIGFNETMIAVSVIAAGLALLTVRTGNQTLTYTGLIVLAWFHGYAHAAEMPAVVDSRLYFSSLLLTSLVVMFISASIAALGRQRYRQSLSWTCLGGGLFFLTAQ